jgi:hypothetical protein
MQPNHAARWATVQVGRLDRTVNGVAGERGCDWHTVNDAVAAYGEASLDADASGSARSTRSVGGDPEGAIVHRSVQYPMPRSTGRSLRCRIRRAGASSRASLTVPRRSETWPGRLA